MFTCCSGRDGRSGPDYSTEAPRSGSAACGSITFAQCNSFPAADGNGNRHGEAGAANRVSNREPGSHCTVGDGDLRRRDRDACPGNANHPAPGSDRDDSRYRDADSDSFSNPQSVR